ncbi:hypothetical protein PSTT_12316 [Puccinia striiformis]|uniref:Integrase catalytic domain-containing protein n=1 Tax=Puccinia striiformis TaxID=27350 RepID=A0A2S4UWM8_9BASI|nr:hypothetical protein PSTT_12316 [Puccinia striiformis]
MDSLTHSNIVTTDNRGSAKALWKAIKDRFASDESSNRARVFHEFLYVKFKEDALESYITDIKVAIKKLFNNENRAETNEPSSSNQAALVSTRSQRSYQKRERAGQPGSGSSGGQRDARRVITIRSKTQTTRRIHAGTYTQIRLQTGGKKLKLNGRPTKMLITTCKKDATLPIKGIGRVVLQWGNSIISLEGCLYVPDIVINLISSGGVIEKGCQIVANQHGFKVSKGELNLFGGKIDNNLFTMTNPDAVGGSIKHSAHFTQTSVKSLKSIHEKYGHASIQRIDHLIPSSVSKAERDSFECKPCVLSKISKQSFKAKSQSVSKVFERIHLDIIGPITPESKIKTRFILTLVDNYSGYLAGFPLAKKDDTTDVLINLLETEKKRIGYLPSLICSDGGGEFIGNRGSLIQKCYWHEVLKACCLALNQIPQKGNPQSPWEIMHGKTLPLCFSNLSVLQTPQPDFKLVDSDIFLPEKLTDKLNSDRQTPNQNAEDKLPQDEDHTSQELSSREENNYHQTDEDDDSSALDDYVSEMLTPKQPDKSVEMSTRVLRDRTTIKPPVRFGFHHYYEPNTFESAIRCSDEKFWKSAIESEITSIENHEVWDNHYQEPPNPLDTTWVFKIKDNCHGDPLKHKARLCVQGFDQIEGVDHEGTFAPTGKVSTLKMILIYSLHQNLTLTQFDVQGAFLHAPLTEEVYIKTPKGVNRHAPYLKLKKALYGLKQAPKNWYETLVAWLESIGFEESSCDPCLYLCNDNVSRVFFHVDDLVLVGPGNNFKEKFEK